MSDPHPLFQVNSSQELISPCCHAAAAVVAGAQHACPCAMSRPSPLCVCLFGQEEETPLHCAAWHGYYSVAKALCEAGCNVNSKNREGETPLLTASARGYHDIVECLSEHGADLNASDKVIWGVGRTTRLLP